MCTSSSCGGDGDGDSGPGSTPFLATWDGKKFSLENDFLFGKPSTNRSENFSIAKEMYESAANRGDKYLIQNAIQPIGNKLVFQIREIEPEISYIDYFRMSYFQKNDDSVYFVTSDHKEVLALTKKDAGTKSFTQKVRYNKNIDISSQMLARLDTILNSEKDRSKIFTQELLKDDTLEIEGGSIDQNKHVYLLVESLFRDWTVGEIFQNKEITKNIAHHFFAISSVRNWVKSPVKMLSLGLIFALSYFGLNDRNKNENQESILSQAFDVSEVHADIPSVKSLLIDYFDPTTNEYKNIEIIEPRYFQASSHLIKLPAEAIQNGKVLMKIQATKRHRVTCASLIVTKNEISSVETTPLELTKAYHRRTKQDFTKKLSKKNKEYLVTWPSDVVDLEFNSPVEDSNSLKNIGFVLEADGFYAAASKDIQKKLGDWVSRLDAESASFLKEMYTLNTTKNKRSISL